MRVPIHIEPLDVLRDRYPAAVSDLINAQAVKDEEIPAPSSDPRHVFDTPEGWRLIVSREQMPSGLIVVHLSASIHSRALRHRLMQRHDWTFDEIFDLWRYLARSDRTPDLLYITSKGIPHFFIEQLT